MTNEIRGYLAKLYEEHERLTPDIVVDDARKATSPLHDLFEWNNKEAGHRYRLIQARRLIRSVRVEVQTNEVLLRTVQYIRDPEAEPTEQGYRSINDLKDTPQAREALLYELNRIEGLLARSRRLAVALGIYEQFDHLVERLETLRTQLAA